jgi:hypothetical protein
MTSTEILPTSDLRVEVLSQFSNTVSLVSMSGETFYRTQAKLDCPLMRVVAIDGVAITDDLPF